MVNVLAFKYIYFLAYEALLNCALSRVCGESQGETIIRVYKEIKLIF